jgi:hypothetical protein
VTKVAAVGLALALFFVPRSRSPVQIAALATVVLIAIQVTANHWFYPYAVWFAPSSSSRSSPLEAPEDAAEVRA